MERVARDIVPAAKLVLPSLVDPSVLVPFPLLPFVGVLDPVSPKLGFRATQPLSLKGWSHRK